MTKPHITEFPLEGHPSTTLAAESMITKTMSVPLAARPGPKPRFLTVLPEGRFLSLDGDMLMVGSGGDCDLVLTDPMVSRRHCRLEWKKDAWWVRDCGSKNGTFLNGIRVFKAQVRAGDALDVGGVFLKLTATRQSDLGLQKVFCGNMVSSDPVMIEVFRTIESLAATDLNVCVRGESGTGKELAARALHEMGPRRKGPFVPVNCGALPAELIESELFGYEKGAFTGADKARAGMFECAQGGTIFLDEIGELPLDQQATLLRVLDSGEVRRLGSARVRAVDVRVVCATNRPLEQLVEWGAFRRDLFYRLCEAAVVLPPLRDRTGDVMLLVRHFSQRVRLGKRCPDPTYAQAARLVEHPWPGNVRELRSVVRRALALGWDRAIESLQPQRDSVTSHFVRDFESKASVADERNPSVTPGGASICAEPLDAAYKAGIRTIDLLEKLEEKIIAEALKHSGGNQTRAAKMLGMHRSTLRQKIKRMRSR